MARRSPKHPVDCQVGALFRSRRRALGISQTELGKRVGLSFQQIQKYERGTNRVSASTLHEIAKALSMPLAEFFDGLPCAARRPDDLARKRRRFAETKEGSAIADLVPRIAQTRRRRAVVNLIRAMAARG